MPGRKLCFWCLLAWRNLVLRTSFNVSVYFFTSSVAFSVSSVVGFIFSVTSSPVSIIPHLYSVRIDTKVRQMTPDVIGDNGDL